MAKDVKLSEVPVANSVAAQATPTVKKTRKKKVTYGTIVNSEYVQVNGKAPENPLDQIVVANRGGLRFPGVIIEEYLGDSIIKLPASGTAIRNPTLRQLYKLLDSIYSVVK